MSSAKEEPCFIFTPIPNGGPVEQDEHFQKTLMEFCRNVGPPVKQREAYLKRRRGIHKRHPPKYGISSIKMAGVHGDFKSIYDSNYEERFPDVRHLPRPATSRQLEREEHHSHRRHIMFHAEDAKELKMADVAARYQDLFRGADAGETHSIGGASFVRSKVKLIPRIFRSTWTAGEPLPHGSSEIEPRALGPAWERQRIRWSTWGRHAQEERDKKSDDQDVDPTMKQLKPARADFSTTYVWFIGRVTVAATLSGTEERP
ncbi:unnamed protein product [Chrysoparadoxa australica]